MKNENNKGNSAECLVEEVCPNGCDEGLSVNYPAGRIILYCPDCGWQMDLNAKADRTEVKI